MATSRTADTGRRVGLTPQRIAAAALAVIDDDGLEAVTMRRLARDLDVTAMALYNHVENRAEVERLVVDHILATGIELRASTDPRDTLVDIAHGLRQLYLSHPNAVPLLQGVATDSGSSLTIIEAALASMIENGTPIEQARTIWIGLVALVNGHVAYQLQGHFTRSDPDIVPSHLSTLRRAVAAGPVDYAAAFSTSVDAYLTGATTARS